jgi:4-diphosphocytidyl-2-C-methyl-D-erythritol kinase
MGSFHSREGGSAADVLRAEAPAKINRELRVGARREDGFHALLSRVVSIDLADTVEVRPAEDLDLVCEGRPIPSGENLVLSAARALAAALGVAPRARIRLEKRIPVGSGLGGGSSDAALALRLLRLLWAPDFPEGDLAPIALRLGSDVPYFLVGGEADVSGRGERVIPREDGPPVELLLVFPPFGVSTAEVFAEHARSTQGRAELPDRLEIESSGRFFGPNELASPVLEIQGAMKAYLDSAAETAPEHGMTGSGSTVVLLGAKPGAESLLAQRHPEASFLRTRTLGRREYGDRTSPSGGPQWTSPR